MAYKIVNDLDYLVNPTFCSSPHSLKSSLLSVPKHAKHTVAIAETV